jgi:hypothetical protein
MALLNASDRLSIIQAGVLAPSADNCHCFELDATNERILLFGSEAYVKAPFHKKILNTISFGAVAENMRVRAAALGYKAAITWLPDPAAPALLAELHFRSAAPQEGSLDAAIPRRHTNRRLMFHGPQLGEPELAFLHQCLADIDGISLRFMDSVAERTKLLRLLRIAETERFNTQGLHHDLFSAVRFDVGWHASAEEGLPPGALGVEPGARWAFRQLARWPVMNMLRRIGLHHALGFRAAYLPCRLAPHRAVLATCLPVDQGAPLVGMALHRIWLQAESRGLALQPFAGPGLLALPAYKEVPAALGERLRLGWRDLVTGTPLMVFRLGLARPPRVRTGRRPIEQYLRS